MTVTFEIPGEPKGKGRPRFGNGRTYTPETTAAYEALVRSEYARQVGKTFPAGPLRMEIIAFYQIPTSASKKTRLEMLSDIIWPTKKPDLDNVAKIIADSLNGVAYKDDSQIVVLQVFKVYSAVPGVEVAISTVE